MVRTSLVGACLAALAWQAAPAPADMPGTARLYVTSVAANLVEQGLAAPAPTGPDAATFERVNGPSIRMFNNVAQATTAPWVDANAWRFQRGMKKAYYEKLVAGSAVPAAAEAFAFNVEAILNPDPADIPELGRFLRFLKAQERALLPAMANIGVVDDKSPQMDEVLNMLTRRNLLYRVVSAPDRKLDLTVQLGSKDFPKESAANASDFAARVREKLSDDKRLVRLYGTSTVIAHLTGEGKRAQLYLLSYTRGGGRGQGGGAGRGQQGSGAGGGAGQPIRIRLLGRYQPVKFAAYGAAEGAKLTDVENLGNATEFSVPAFTALAIIDLETVK
jgi:hypothetical protein